MWLCLHAFWSFALGASSPPPPPPPKVDLTALPASASARGPVSNKKPHPVLARLLVDRETLVPGQTARVGVLLEQDEGWHTYWKTPG
jgi:DsbC/DsbD-like thiol-disulfide interchange protein